jgi:predicted Zn-dependent protease with MMP-like domain
MSDDRWGHAPSLDEMAAMAARAFAALPEQFRRMAGEVVFRVDDFPPDDVLDELGIEDPFGLTGLSRRDAHVRADARPCDRRRGTADDRTSRPL